ncbi:MAG: hypothetical protein MI723_06215, partial [Caulobacterales bacterium]|nr:hypothetical protein [Caulobacterales bacterium]
GIVTGVGEIVGGAAAPALTGVAAQSAGIHIVPGLAMAAATVSFFIVLFGFRETKNVVGARPVATAGGA